MPTLAVIHCRQLVTLAGPDGPRAGAAMRDVRVIEDGSMLIADGRITAVGKTDDLEIPRDAEIIDAKRQIVLPGFVDAHTHPVFGGNRSDEFALRASGATYAEIAAKGGGIRSTVAKTRAASADELYQIGLKHADLFIRHGTTTIEAKSGYGLTLEDELKILRVIKRLGEDTPLGFHPTFLGAHAFPSEFAEDRPGYERLVIDEMLPVVASEKLAKWCDIFVEKNYFDSESARRILSRAKELGLGIRIHADQLSDGRGAHLAAELGAITADHLEQTTSGAHSAMRDANVIPVLLPASVFCLGLTKYPDAGGMIDSGLPVVLATDFNPGSSPTTSMPFVMSLACTQMRVTPEEALTAATINAAHSLGLGDTIGSLETGKRADFTVWPCEDWREIPYWVASLLPSSVYIGGVRR